MGWQDSQDWERAWWGSCTNTYNEEMKQLTYASRMGLHAFMREGKYPVYDLRGASVLDVGGGPTSILLKCINRGACEVRDPCSFPHWVYERYAMEKINCTVLPGETIHYPGFFDEVWCYNVLQHVINPQTIVERMLEHSRIVRIYEWINTPTNLGHPHSLTAEGLNSWLGGEGKTEQFTDRFLYGTAYYGIFKGGHYA